MAKWPYNTIQWQKLRLAKLTATPLCEPCRMRGQVTVAKAVDHMTPINAGGDPFPPLDGLTSMCERCHNEKTAANDRKHKKPFARKVKGFDASGNPADQSDAWHRGGGGSNHQNEAGRGPMSQIGIYLVSEGQAFEENDETGFS
ncbi:HNH endonuclease [Agrobacterium vitis]|uniref:HNH endonuclease n=1 Tax=Agrobacterium vitis TaxID=373 RepID=A0A368NVY1_AGRVI|nr:HNH endonuclease [Agrobacterium vitis]KAA3514803.1 HNH endonuclease [Agrobacterium vitis]KAA3528401.1 HNH endonuclease [Agrobacterium vitis]MCF1477853.1 HNH endonuclease [Agrobacterium vitis]MUZ98096.1 HNH endonuclease [Agrobacterium vitis]MVA31002.1 HNH endonuclease [Agrobacterium vitis]